MSYCTKCGAYIPDGQTRCLACGFDEAAAAVKAAGFKSVEVLTVNGFETQEL